MQFRTGGLWLGVLGCLALAACANGEPSRPMVAKPGVCDLLNEPYATPSEIKALAQRAEQASTGVLDAGSLSAANAAAFSELQSASLAFKVTVGREAYRLSLAPGTKTNLEERPTLAEARFRLNAACRAYES